jgi:hypothetical protein
LTDNSPTTCVSVYLHSLAVAVNQKKVTNINLLAFTLFKISHFLFSTLAQVKTTIAANTANIVFDAPVITTVSSPYNITSKTVTSVPDSGVYWFQLAAGVPANTQTNTRLNGLQYPVAVVSSTTNYPMTSW